MALSFYNIGGFQGINQSMNENYIRESETPDARNMDTTDGDLMVAAGYVRHFGEPVPGTGLIRRHYVWRGIAWTRHIVIAGAEVYARTDKNNGDTGAWKKIYTYMTAEGQADFVGLRWDFLETFIGERDILIIANGERQMIQWDGLSETAELFGSAEMKSAPPCNFVEIHYGRLFAAGDPARPSALYYSRDPNDMQNKAGIADWSVGTSASSTAGGSIVVGDTNTDPIVGLCSMSNQLLIFKRNSIYRLLGSNPDNYTLHRVFAEVETTTNTSVAIYGDTPYWMTREGMYYHDGQSSMPTRFARNIHKFLKTARLTMCKAAEHEGKMYFTCRTDDESTPYDNAMIVYNIRDAAYMIRDGFEVADICAAGALYMINHNRTVYRFNEGDTYDGDPIYAWWKTPVTDLLRKTMIKKLQGLYLRAEEVGTVEGEGAVVLIHSFVDRFAQFQRHLIPKEPTSVLEIPLMNEGRTFSLRLLNEAGSRWRISGGVQLLYESKERVK